MDYAPLAISDITLDKFRRVHPNARRATVGPPTGRPGTSLEIRPAEAMIWWDDNRMRYLSFLIDRKDQTFWLTFVGKAVPFFITESVP